MIEFLDPQFSEITFFLKENKYSTIFILVDENTHEYCLPILLQNVETSVPFEIIEIEAGEELKNIQTATHLWEILTEMNADRKSLLINLGGGVISDMGGFVASTYKRGIDFINIPTTLLSICDASMGGKTGIDLGCYKNMVGTFCLPKKIFVYPNFLFSLPEEQRISGFAEMLKHGLIANKMHWEQLISLEEVEVKALIPHIKTSMEIKNSIVELDFKEANIRKNLNFGHTIGHAIESLFLEKGNPIFHGQAVAIGMICETYLSFLENHLSESMANEIIERLYRIYPTIDCSGFSTQEIHQLLLNDKKNTHATIRFSLLSSIGKGIYDVECTNENIIKSIEFYKNKRI